MPGPDRGGERVGWVGGWVCVKGGGGVLPCRKRRTNFSTPWWGVARAVARENSGINLGRWGGRGVGGGRERRGVRGVCV